ncbi:MAG: hypothetical protein WDN44_04360 [Sphingomonas sp.]
MGQDGHDRGANLVSSMFGDLGFEVVPGPLFQDAGRGGGARGRAASRLVGASSLAAGHKTLIPELIAALKDAGRADIKVVAGGVIPARTMNSSRGGGCRRSSGRGPIWSRRRARCSGCWGTTCRRSRKLPSDSPIFRHPELVQGPRCSMQRRPIGELLRTVWPPGGARGCPSRRWFRSPGRASGHLCFRQAPGRPCRPSGRR